MGMGKNRILRNINTTISSLKINQNLGVGIGKIEITLAQ